MVEEFHAKLVIPKPENTTVVPYVQVTNIWAITDLVEENKEEIRERKRIKNEYKYVEKKAKAASLQDKQDQETQVGEMAVGAGGSRLLVEDIKRGSVVDLPSATVVDSVLVADGMHDNNSGTWSEGPRADNC